jgi:hypothetical protein
VRRIAVAAGLLVLLVSSSAAAQPPSPQGFGGPREWVEYEDRSEFLFVNFPGQPVITTTTYQPQRGAPLPGRIYTVQDGLRRYTVTVINLEKAAVNDLPGAIAWEAWNFRKRGGEVTYDAYGQVDRIAGHQLHINNPDKTQSLIGIYLHARRLYILEARVPPDSPGAVHFQQSLQVLDEQGERVRYRILDDGTRGPRDTGFDPVVCH